MTNYGRIQQSVWAIIRDLSREGDFISKSVHTIRARGKTVLSEVYLLINIRGGQVVAGRHKS